MNGAQILAQYGEIAQLTRNMLAAARAAEWERLVELERTCSSYFARLFESGAAQPADATFINRKAALIRGILDDDAEIRLLVEPWLAQLSLLIGNTQQQSRLQRAYRPGE